jgi:hypothetical protein
MTTTPNPGTAIQQTMDAMANGFATDEEPIDDAAEVLPTVNEAWAAVMTEVEQVAKAQTADMGRGGSYKFRGVDAVVDAVGPALRRHGVFIHPKRIKKIVTTEYETKNGGRMVNKEVTVKWQVRGPLGDSFCGESVGEAADSGDKSIAKAQSVAYRVYLLQSLCIPSGDRDPDYDNHERAARQGVIDEDALAAANEARGELLNKTAPYGWTGDTLCERFRSDYDKDLLAVTNLDVIRAFGEVLIAEAQRSNDTAKQPGRGINDAQLRKLHTLLGKQQIVDHDAKIEWCVKEIGHGLDSTKNLTFAEAKALIERLEKITKVPPNKESDVQ